MAVKYKNVNLSYFILEKVQLIARWKTVIYILRIAEKNLVVIDFAGILKDNSFTLDLFY